MLFLISNLGLGGAERQLVYLALGLKERGWTVEIANLSPLFDPSFERLLVEARIPVHTMQEGMSANVAALGKVVRGLNRLIRQSKPAVLVGFMPHGAILARLLGALSGVRTVVTSLRNIKSTHRWHDWLLAATRKLDHACVTNSVLAAEEQLRAGVTTSSKSVVIHNGLDLTRVAGSAQGARENRPDASFIWLNIAVFRREKGHAVLFEAVRKLARHRNFKLRMAGEGPLLEEMKQLARLLEIASHVEFLGWQADIRDLLRTADGFVLSSLWEGLPNALIEAMAGGLPAVSTEVGGCSEIVEQGVSGLLVPPLDAQALAGAMVQVMDMSAEERARMGMRGRQHSLASFSMEQMVSGWERVLARRR